MQKLEPTEEDVDAIIIQFELLKKAFEDRGFHTVQYSNFLIAESAKGYSESGVKKKEYLKICGEAFDTFK